MQALARSRSEGEEVHITLDVSGMLFKTNLTTLLRGGSPYFADRLHQARLATLFIDRNAESFSLILDLLRGYPLHLHLLKPVLRSLVEADLDFYKLRHLLEK